MDDFSEDGELRQHLTTSTVAPMRDVEGKVAFITGGDSGIGLGIARAFVNAGMKVAITYRSRVHLQEAMAALRHATECVHAIHLDVTDRAAVASAAEETVQVFGKVHILVNNAGIGMLAPLTSATFDEWDWCMNVNLTGVFNGVRAFLPHIRAHREGGHIVSTASMLGGVIVGPYWGLYSTSKFAVVGMMEALRSELAGSNIGVSVFCPAGVSSNIGDSDRNCPAELTRSGAVDPEVSPVVEKFNKAVMGIVENGSIDIEPLEAGEHVLRGIRSNDLYILSHPEYEQAIRDRNDALVSSIPRTESALSASRLAIGRIVRNPIYHARRIP